ncbi:hypothetical protein BC830DRAFT_779554 [Chytriomyces sp. MP71]|nr:hypothetical protein BC830DRAFT_779554 [Chytriomyces sp. MP71]
MDHLSVDGDLLYTHLFENVILCCSKEVRQQRRAISLNFFRPTTPEGNSGSYSYIVSSAVRISAITRIEDSSDPRINSYSLIIQFTKSKGSVPSKLPINFRNGEQLNLWKDRLDKMIALYTTIRGSHDMSEPAPSIRSSSRASISSDQSTDEMAIGSFRSLSPFLSRSNTIVSTARPASATGFMSHPFAQRIESAPTPPTIHHHQPLPTRFYSTASMPPPSTTPLPADTSLAEGEALLGLALRSMSEPFPTGEFEEPRPMSPHTRLLAPSPLSSETQESISEEEASESEAEDYPASDPAALSPSPSSSLADENSLSLNKSLASISKPAQQCSTTEVTTRHYPPPLVSRSLPATPPPLARCTTTKVTRRPSMARIRTARPPFVRMHLHTGSDPQTDTTAATLSYPTFGATLSDLRTRVARKLKVEGGAAGVRLFVVRGEAGWKDVATLETEGQFWDVLGREEVDLVVVEVHAE